MRYLLVATLMVLGSTPVPGDEKPDLSKLPPAANRRIDFHREVEPLLVRACRSCHGAQKQKGGLRLDAPDHFRNGGNSGPAVKPGDSAHSRLIQLVAGIDPELKMPPEGKPSLSKDEVGILRAWIDQGASWPKPTTTSSPIAASTSSHWAYQPIRRPPLPHVGLSGWARNGIDTFILARLEKERLTPSPEADRPTLIRRLSFDLLGLPPSPEQVDAFVNDSRTDAYERLVDRLLASPQYGERWGRHWLDMARYADSDGYEKDTGRPYAWRWRDWVIGALNSDMPFDQFTIAQLAGDLVPNATLEDKIATGFHRNTLTNKEGGVDQEQFRVEALVDRVNTTGKVFLGTTVGCAQCHDHKYDPFSQREYYELIAFFNSDREVDLPAPFAGEEPVFKKQKAAWDAEKQKLKNAVDEYKKGMKTPNPKDAKLAQLTKRVTDHDKKMPRLAYAQTLALGPGRKTHVLVRGDFLRPGVEVKAGTPGVLPQVKTGRDATRIDLARWLVNKDNPLTPRVTVNWVWQRFFGRGLVATLEDFGTQGDRPTHPELLDWLASEFTAVPPGQIRTDLPESRSRAWDLKHLHRLIVASATYRQSSKETPQLLVRDPLNVFLARQSRMRFEAELLRDNVLAVSGLLTPKIGGPSVRPPQPAGIAELSYANSVKWVDSTGPDRQRRGVYTWFQRTSPYPMLMTFDAPDGNLSCVRRERSNTPLQALTLLNDPVFVEGARAFADRLLRAAPSSPQKRIDLAFRACVARQPTSAERSILANLYANFLRDCQEHPQAALKLAFPAANPTEVAATIALARALMNLDEFVTRE